MKRKLRTANRGILRATFGPALLCFCLSVVCSFGLGFALTADSNQRMLIRQTAVEQQSIFPVPGNSLKEELRSARSAACGAIFYAFSLGVGLPALILPFLYFFRGPGRPSVVKWVLLLSVTVILGFSLNHLVLGFRGPAFVLGTGFWVYLWLFRSGSNNMVRLKKILRALPGFAGAVLLLVLIALTSGIRDFKSVRDAFLVSNEWGRFVNDFYYQYTLMAAEPIKLPARKTQPVCAATRAQFEEEEWRLISRILNEIGVIPVGLSWDDPKISADWILTKENPYLIVTAPNSGKEVRMEMNELSSLPNVLLHGNWGAAEKRLRFWIGLSLFVGIPGAVLGGAALVLTRIIRGLARLTGRRDSVLWETVFPVGAALLAGFRLMVPFPTDAGELTRIALSESGWTQVRALRSLGGVMGPGFNNSEVLLRLLSDTDVRVRYWAARAVRGNEGKPVMNRLIFNLMDPSVYSASASAHGLKRFHSPEVDRALRHAYLTRAEWYLQDAVYRALRAHGKPYLTGDG